MKNNEFVTIKEKSITKEKTEEAAEDKKISEELENAFNESKYNFAFPKSAVE